jgi:hypothetical protein
VPIAARACSYSLSNPVTLILKLIDKCERWCECATEAASDNHLLEFDSYAMKANAT